MSKFSFIILSTCLVTLCSTSVYAGQPAGDKAGGKGGICEELRSKDATPGLYGLCVAYHESGATNQGFVDKYNDRKGPNDPVDMPGTGGVPDPDSDPDPKLLECACWNNLTADEIGTGFILDHSAPYIDPSAYYDGVWYNDYNPDTYFSEALIVEGDTCLYSFGDDPIEDPYTNKMRLTESEEKVCRDEIMDFVCRDFIPGGCP